MQHHQPSVEPQTSSLVKEQQNLSPYYASLCRRFSRSVFPVEHGRVSRLLRRRTCPSSTKSPESSFRFESEAPTGFRQPVLQSPSPAPPVTFNRKGALGVAAGRRRRDLDQIRCSSDVPFSLVSPRPNCVGRGMEEYTEGFRLVKRCRTVFFRPASTPTFALVIRPAKPRVHPPATGRTL